MGHDAAIGRHGASSTRRSATYFAVKLVNVCFLRITICHVYTRTSTCVCIYVYIHTCLLIYLHVFLLVYLNTCTRNHQSFYVHVRTILINIETASLNSRPVQGRLVERRQRLSIGDWHKQAAVGITVPLEMQSIPSTGLRACNGCRGRRLCGKTVQKCAYTMHKVVRRYAYTSSNKYAHKHVNLCSLRCDTVTSGRIHMKQRGRAFEMAVHRGQFVDSL